MSGAPVIVPPISPFRGLRTVDAHGSGGFGAPRTKGDVRYVHPGVDCAAAPGDAVVRPIPGTVVHYGSAYVDDPRTPFDESGFGSVWIKGEPGTPYAAWLVKLFYAALTWVKVGDCASTAGDRIGEAQDRAAFARLLHPDRGPMTNHVHLGLWIGGVLADPTPYLAIPHVD